MNIKDIRTRKGLTQAEVASALGVFGLIGHIPQLPHADTAICGSFFQTNGNALPNRTEIFFFCSRHLFRLLVFPEIGHIFTSVSELVPSPVVFCCSCESLLPGFVRLPSHFPFAVFFCEIPTLFQKIFLCRFQKTKKAPTAPV